MGFQHKKSEILNKVKPWSSDPVSLHLHTQAGFPANRQRGSAVVKVGFFFTPLVMQFVFSVLGIYRPVNTFIIIIILSIQSLLSAPCSDTLDYSLHSFGSNQVNVLRKGLTKGHMCLARRILYAKLPFSWQISSTPSCSLSLFQPPA